MELNIVALIENNPLSKLSSTYNNKLLNTMKKEFNDYEQQLFVSSFYCYLKYDKTSDFVVDLDSIWKWLGFTQKIDAKRLLEKKFIYDVDYKIFALDSTKASLENKKHGGQNKQTIMMTIKCFKSLCLKAQTKKADEIHDYYIKMEDILHKIIEEETNELKEQLEEKKQDISNLLENIHFYEETEQLLIEKNKKNIEEEKKKAFEKAIVSQFPVNTECIYFGTIDNTNEKGEKLIKFGHSNDLHIRVLDHRKTYDNFILINAFRVQNKVEIENLIKKHEKVKRHLRTIEIKFAKKTEIVAYDETYFTVDKFTKYIKDIIHSKTYSIDNFNRLMKENEDLKETLRTKDVLLEEKDVSILQRDQEIKELKEAVTQKTLLIESLKHEEDDDANENDELTNSFRQFISLYCIKNKEAEVSSKDIQGLYRLWTKKPSKESYQAFKYYLDLKFKTCRVKKQDKNQIVHGYRGIGILPREYKKRIVQSDVQNYLFHTCCFSPAASMLFEPLLKEYIKWKQSLEILVTGDEEKELREYLKDSDYVLYTTVWTPEGNGQGYYGIHFKKDENTYKKTSATGKRVEKRLVANDTVIATWDTIAKAAIDEDMCASKMSQSISNKRRFGDCYYCAISV